ncbi:hypothetical protein BDV59DRAFT_104444 [Aspergillus ambiguus]|uniref:uncharacterized protein n=1 Tax=Aspergillus ambiguus TaxID=176160 RepID=UPI003CCCC752
MFVAPTTRIRIPTPSQPHRFLLIIASPLTNGHYHHEPPPAGRTSDIGHLSSYAQEEIASAHNPPGSSPQATPEKRKEEERKRN